MAGTRKTIIWGEGKKAFFDLCELLAIKKSVLLKLDAKDEQGVKYNEKLRDAVKKLVEHLVKAGKPVVVKDANFESEKTLVELMRRLVDEGCKYYFGTKDKSGNYSYLIVVGDENSPYNLDRLVTAMFASWKKDKDKDDAASVAKLREKNEAAKANRKGDYAPDLENTVWENVVRVDTSHSGHRRKSQLDRLRGMKESLLPIDFERSEEAVRKKEGNGNKEPKIDAGGRPDALFENGSESIQLIRADIDQIVSGAAKRELSLIQVIARILLLVRNNPAAIFAQFQMEAFYDKETLRQYVSRKYTEGGRVNTDLRFLSSFLYSNEETLRELQSGIEEGYVDDIMSFLREYSGRLNFFTPLFEGGENLPEYIGRKFPPQDRASLLQALNEQFPRFFGSVLSNDDIRDDGSHGSSVSEEEKEEAQKNGSEKDELFGAGDHQGSEDPSTDVDIGTEEDAEKDSGKFPLISCDLRLPVEGNGAGESEQPVNLLVETTSPSANEDRLGKKEDKSGGGKVYFPLRDSEEQGKNDEGIDKGNPDLGTEKEKKLNHAPEERDKKLEERHQSKEEPMRSKKASGKEKKETQNPDKFKMEDDHVNPKKNELNKYIEDLGERLGQPQKEIDNLKVVLKKLYNDGEDAQEILNLLYNIFKDCVQKIIKGTKTLNQLYQLRMDLFALNEAVDKRNEKEKGVGISSKNEVGRGRDEYDVCFCSDVRRVKLLPLDLGKGKIYVDSDGRYAVFEPKAKQQSSGLAPKPSEGSSKEVTPAFTGSLPEEPALNGQVIPSDKYKDQNALNSPIAKADILEVVILNKDLPKGLAINPLLVPTRLRVQCKFKDYSSIARSHLDNPVEEAEKFVRRLFACVSDLCIERDSALNTLETQEKALGALKEKFARGRAHICSSGASSDEVKRIDLEIGTCIYLNRLYSMRIEQPEFQDGEFVRVDLAQSIVNLDVRIEALSKDVEAFLSSGQNFDVSLFTKSGGVSLASSALGPKPSRLNLKPIGLGQANNGSSSSADGGEIGFDDVSPDDSKGAPHFPLVFQIGRLEDGSIPGPGAAAPKPEDDADDTLLSEEDDGSDVSGEEEEQENGQEQDELSENDNNSDSDGSSGSSTAVDTDTGGDTGSEDEHRSETGVGGNPTPANGQAIPALPPMNQPLRPDNGPAGPHDEGVSDDGVRPAKRRKRKQGGDGGSDESDSESNLSDEEDAPDNSAGAPTPVGTLRGKPIQSVEVDGALHTLTDGVPPLSVIPVSSVPSTPIPHTPPLVPVVENHEGRSSLYYALKAMYDHLQKAKGYEHISLPELQQCLDNLKKIKDNKDNPALMVGGQSLWRTLNPKNEKFKAKNLLSAADGAEDILDTAIANHKDIYLPKFSAKLNLPGGKYPDSGKYYFQRSEDDRIVLKLRKGATLSPEELRCAFRELAVICEDLRGSGNTPKRDICIHESSFTQKPENQKEIAIIVQRLGLELAPEGENEAVSPDYASEEESLAHSASDSESEELRSSRRRDIPHASHAGVRRFSEQMKVKPLESAEERISDISILDETALRRYRTMNSKGCYLPQSEQSLAKEKPLYKEYLAKTAVWETAGDWNYLNALDITRVALPVAAKVEVDKDESKYDYLQEKVQVQVKPLEAFSLAALELETQANVEKWCKEGKQRYTEENMRRESQRCDAAQEGQYEPPRGWESPRSDVSGDDSDREGSGSEYEDDAYSTDSGSKEEDVPLSPPTLRQPSDSSRRPAEAAVVIRNYHPALGEVIHPHSDASYSSSQAIYSPPSSQRDYDLPAGMQASLVSHHREIQSSQTKAIPGFVLQPVPRDGHCFYTAVAHQLSLICPDKWPEGTRNILSADGTISSWAGALRAVVVSAGHYENHAGSQYVEQKHIQTFVRETGLMVALVLNNQPNENMRGIEGFDLCFQPQLDGDMETIEGGTYALYQEDQPVVRLAFDAASGHYDSVASHGNLCAGALRGSFRENTYPAGCSVLSVLKPDSHPLRPSSFGSSSSFWGSPFSRKQPGERSSPCSTAPGTVILEGGSPQPTIREKKGK